LRLTRRWCKTCLIIRSLSPTYHAFPFILIFSTFFKQSGNIFLTQSQNNAIFAPQFSWQRLTWVSPGGLTPDDHARLGHRRRGVFMEDVYLRLFLTSRNYHLQNLSRIKAEVDVLWDKYILSPLRPFLWPMPAISAACGTLHTYDVGLCQLLDSEDAGCGRPLDAEASKYSRPRLSF